MYIFARKFLKYLTYLLAYSLTVNKLIHWIAVCVGISGLFSATFPLTFAYISDCVEKKNRAPAYGLALATLGLSFCVGPPLGGYIELNYGSHFVFITAFILVVICIVYIILVLPETVVTTETFDTQVSVIWYMCIDLPWTCIHISLYSHITAYL